MNFKRIIFMGVVTVLLLINMSNQTFTFASALNQNSLLGDAIQLSESKNNPEVNFENCGCDVGSKLTDDKSTTTLESGKNMGKLTDQAVIDSFKEFISIKVPSKATNYSFNDFNWSNATHSYFDDKKVFNVQVPAVSYDLNDNPYFLVFNYNEKGEITTPLVIKLNKKGKDSGEIIYATLDDDPIQKIYMENGEYVESEFVESEFAVNKSEGYWSCVKRCLKRAWEESIHEPIKWVCGGACSSCLWGPNPLNCSACVGCLGGAAAACTAGCWAIG